MALLERASGKTEKPKNTSKLIESKRVVNGKVLRDKHVVFGPMRDKTKHVINNRASIDLSEKPKPRPLSVEEKDEADKLIKEITKDMVSRRDMKSGANHAIIRHTNWQEKNEGLISRYQMLREKDHSLASIESFRRD